MNAMVKSGNLIKVYFSLILIIISFSRGQSQLFISIQTGPEIFGAQDLKFKYFDNEGKLDILYKTSDVDGNFNLLNSFGITWWGSSGFFEDIGIKLEYINWDITTSIDDFPSRYKMPFNQIEQERKSFFVNFILRNHFKWKIAGFKNISSLFYGLGAGPTLTNVTYGKKEWNIGFQALMGLTLPISRKKIFIFEAKYIITHDADNNTGYNGWYVDTSGTPTIFRFHPHLDTRFIGIMVGINYKIR